ncbi:S9 family peptidase [Kordiimonas pumila]|uniref:S9 family peptidase n=1 Tax=Kordiimonas pumila TaxID=2161677 RepID=A0ABV7D469_9PROT|nr:S9 family peptidase [Kordiimonas pumila]
MNVQQGLWLAVFCMAGALSAASAADKGQSFDLQALHKVQAVGTPSLSPDGSLVVYDVSYNDVEKDVSTSDIWLVPYAGGTPYKLIDTPDKSEWAPQFSPDGKTIAFLSEAEDGTSQLFTVPVTGTTVQQITDVAEGVLEFDWAPDSKRLVFTAFVGSAQANAAGTAAPVVVNRFKYQEDWVGYLTGQRRHMHIVDVVQKTTVQITRGEQDFWLPAWSPDGRWIAVVSKDTGDVDKNLNTDVFIMPPVEGGALKRISTFDGTDVDPDWASPPAWSPDSEKLVWLASGESKWIYYAPWQLTVANIHTGDVREVARIDRCFYVPKWSADSVHVVALLEEDRATWVTKINTETEEITRLTQGPKFAYGFDLAGDDHIVVLQSDDNTPYELYSVGSDEQKLTAHNDWLRGYSLAKTEAFDFESDGHMIGGLIVYPPDYDASKTYPALFRLHGGPVYQYSHEFEADWQIYAASGYIVVGINPRGSSGKGFEFAKAIYADWGNVDSKDIIAGVQYLAGKGIIDKTRLGTGGWSYGGMLTNYVIATDTTFKAAVSGAGSANMLGMYGHDQYAREYELELGTPWHNMDAYLRVSFPFFKADKITTATLYQCAEKDLNVPCLGAEQMYQALKSLGTDTELVIYPGEHHGLTVPSYQEDRIRRNLSWYNRYLKKISD